MGKLMNALQVTIFIRLTSKWDSWLKIYQHWADLILAMFPHGISNWDQFQIFVNIGLDGRLFLITDYVLSFKDNAMKIWQ